MSTHTRICTNCGHNQAIYRKQVVVSRSVDKVEGGTVVIDRRAEEEVQESGCYCARCDQPLPHLDDLEKEVLD